MLVGLLGDRLHDVETVILVATVGSAGAVFLFWGLADRVGLLVVFAMLYGFFAGGFSATWAGVAVRVKEEMEAVDTGLVFGMLAGGRGVGNVVSGPLSAALVGKGGGSSAGGVGGARLGYESQYAWVFVFTGLTAVMGGWRWGWRVCQGMKR